jgi:hypothetical protein
VRLQTAVSYLALVAGSGPAGAMDMENRPQERTGGKLGRARKVSDEPTQRLSDDQVLALKVVTHRQLARGRTSRS